MRFGVIGLGSMGKRRARDLVTLGHEVIGFDLRPERNREAHDLFKIATVPEWDALLEMKPDALVLSTPPDQHVQQYEHSFGACLPFFSESNILTPRVKWFAEREARSGVRGFPSATWRFYSLFETLRRQLQEIGLDQVNSIHCHYGGYLPLWHPWEHYTQFYAGSRRQTCAAREMVPFEMEWLYWIFGPIRAVCAVRDRRFDWDTDIDDTYMLLLEFESGLKGTLNIELHHVAPFRVSRISCRRNSFLLDIAAHELRQFDLDTKSWRVMKPQGRRSESCDFEQVYLAEIKAFVDALERTAIYPKTWADDRHLSNIVFAAEESWRRREWVEIKEADCLCEGISTT